MTKWFVAVWIDRGLAYTVAAKSGYATKACLQRRRPLQDKQEWRRYKINLENVAARQDANRFAGGEFGAVAGKVKEAVGFGYCGEVAGTLPANGFHGGDAVRPFETRGKEMGEAGFFLERFGEMRFEEGQR